MFSLPGTTIPCVHVIALSCPTSPGFSYILQSKPANCMETTPVRWTSGVHRKPRIPKSRDSPLHPTRRSASEQQLQQFSSPLPQTEWSKPEQRPRSYVETQPRRQSSYYSNTVPNFSRHVTPPPTSTSLEWEESGERTSPPRHDYHDRTSSPREDEGMLQSPRDASLLYPQMHPYEDRRSTYSAPEELEYSPPRSLGSDDELANMTLSNPEEATPTNAQRTATYPPSTIRRARSTSTIPDNTFADEEEFNLFAQATSGFGLDEPFSAPPFSTSPPRSSPPRLPQPSARGPPHSASSASLPYRGADSTTPVIAQAIRQLEQLLGDSQSSVISQRQQRQRQRGPPPSEHDLRAQALEAAAFEAEMARWDEDGYDERDEELPDYAQSQAQAQARQRIEAARRAQELQRRWQLSGSRRPI